MVKQLKLVVAIGVVAVSAGWQVVAAQTAAQDPRVTIKMEPAKPTASLDGGVSYAAYCAACHGKDGMGNGPATPALKVAPADLTKLSARNGGNFDAMKVKEMILGTTKVAPSHGSPDMPIWGPVFRAMSLDNATERLRVQNLVNYLKSIQTK